MTEQTVAHTIRLSRADADRSLVELLDLYPAGLQEREPDAETIEYILYGAVSDLPSIERVRAVLGPQIDISSTVVADDWKDEWKRFHRPITVNGRDGQIRVSPSWETETLPGQPTPGTDQLHELIIDPGQAFGTGSHATTKLCLELLLDLSPSGSFADWGCGSGVLAIAASKLGYQQVYACDNDPLAIEATTTNAEVNKAPDIIITQVDLALQPGPVADTVAANLSRPLLVEALRLLYHHPKHLIVSGLLQSEVDEVSHACAGLGLQETERRVSGDWAALLLAGAD